MYYLIDSENIARWEKYIFSKSATEPDSKFVVVLSQKSSTLPISVSTMLQLNSIKNLSYEFAKNGRPNALDFSLVMMIGILHKKHPKETFVIVSKDKGYESAIQTAKNYGIKIYRDCSFDDPNSNSNSKASMLEPCVMPQTVANGLIAAKLSKMTQNEQKKLRAAQREFLVNKCGVSPKMSEPVRKALEISVDNLEKMLHKTSSSEYKNNETKIHELLQTVSRCYYEFSKL